MPGAPVTVGFNHYRMVTLRPGIVFLPAVPVLCVCWVSSIVVVAIVVVMIPSSSVVWVLGVVGLIVPGP